MFGRRTPAKPEVKYPGQRSAVDGNTAVILCEREASDAAGAYPITPSTQMGEYWAEAAAAGHLNISGRPLIFVEPEGEHAAAAVTAGLSMTGLRAANFSSGQGIAYMHESLYAAVGKRLTYVLNMGSRAMTKASLNVHAGHDDYHCIDDTGFFQLFAKNGQSAADLNLIAHRIAELALTPGVVAQDGFLTTHLIESIQVPERELIAEYLGRPDDVIQTPTAAQRMLFGDTRRRIPILWDVDHPVMSGVVQNQDAYMQSVAAQRPFFFDHIAELSEQAFREFEALTGRSYRRVLTHACEDAEYLILGQGSLIPTAEVVADYLRQSRGLRVGVVDLVMFRPFPADLLARVLRGKRGVAVLERLDQPLAGDLPLMREVRGVVSKCLEKAAEPEAYPELIPYTAPKDMPQLFSGSFGLGSRDLQPEGVIAAIENMLPEGKRRRFFYLSIDFLHDEARTPMQKLHQEAIERDYPSVRSLALHGSENPNLMPKDSITARFHSIGGWGAITTGKNLAMTLFDLLGYHIKANPKYGSEKKGQPTTYYLSAAPEPIRVNCEYIYVDVVLSPDPNVFSHTNALHGLKRGGVFILQSEHTGPEDVWRSIPRPFQKIVLEQQLRVYFLDAFRIAREEATDPDLQLRMQGIAFQGAFFRASGLMERAGLDEARLLTAIRDQLEHKFGTKGARVVADNLRVVQRGFDELQELKPTELSEPGSSARESAGPELPIMLERLPESRSSLADVHRFWQQTGSFYARGMGSDNLADPFIGLSLMPASSALFRDMTQIRFQHPEWNPENCTACGKCWTVCPDTAIPGLVHELGAVLDTVVRRLRARGESFELLPKAIRAVETRARGLLHEAAVSDAVAGILDEAFDQVLLEAPATDRETLEREFSLFRDELADFPLALSRPYFSLHEQQQQGSGGLLSITVNPYSCKGCMECVEVCDDDALHPVPQTKESIAELRKHWELWLDLPNTPKRFIRIQDLESAAGALDTLLLDKANYLAFSSGDGACLGCSEKTTLHLFVATVEALMRPRVERHLEYLRDLIGRLERHVQLRIVRDVDMSDPTKLARLIAERKDPDVTLAGLSEGLTGSADAQPIDPEWLQEMSELIAALKRLEVNYTSGVTGRGRSHMGILNSTGCTSVWGSTYPFNPYPFPWSNHLFQDSPSLAMGVFEGHMAKMADGFKTIRLAELELEDQLRPGRSRDELAYFDWHQFSDDEWSLCPPVVSVGGDGAMYDIGFQNLSRLMASGKPIKVLVVDTQVYSNTGGQACTSGFLGQISDMAQFGRVGRGKQEPRKEIGLIGMAHRTTYVAQSTIAHPNHMIESFIHGLAARRPALFNIYSSCQPEHGIGDDKSAAQAKLAVESRAYPLFRYDPAAGPDPRAAFDLEGNPSVDRDWPSYTLHYRDGRRDKSLELRLTFADFALSEVRFRKHFRMAPRDTWNPNMLGLADFVELDPAEREGKFPFVWTVNAKRELTRLIVDETMVAATEERREFFRMLRSLAGVDQPEGPSREQIEDEVRRDFAQRIAGSLLALASGTGAPEAGLLPLLTTAVAPSEPSTATETAATPKPGQSEGYLAPWLDSENCTACDECTRLNPRIFAYGDDKKAYIQNPEGGPYRDLVKAAERCAARVIHPGLPRKRGDADTERWIARGEKFNG